MKLYKRIAAVCAAALMSLSLTACGDTSWVYKSGESTISSGVYLGYLTQGYLNGQSESDFDTEVKNIWKQKISGKSYKDYVTDYAKNASARYIAIEQKFEELGLELSDEDNQTIETQVYYLWDLYGMGAAYYQPNGTSKESFTKIITSSIKEDLIFEKYYGEGGLEEVPEKDLIKELLDNYADVNYFAMSFSDGEAAVMSSAEIEALKKQAEEYAERINSGKATFNEVKTEYEDEVAKKKAEEADQEFIATKPEDIQKDEDTKSLIAKDSTSPSEEFVKTIFEDVKYGASVITIDTNYYVVVKYDLNDDLDDNLDAARSGILNTLKAADFTELSDEWTAAVTTEENTSSLHRYSPKNIKEPEAE